MTPYAEALAWALVHFVWQGAALALAAFLITRWLRLGASGRYAIGIATLAAMLASPAVTVAVLLDSTPPAVTIAQPPVSSRIDPPAPQISSVSPPVPRDAVPALSRSTVWLLGAWILGVAVCSLRLAGGWVVARRMVTRAVRPVAPDIALLARRLAARLALERAVRLLESSSVSVPVVVGWLKPVILLPAVAVCGLTPTQLEALIAHELAHVRRQDYLVNLLQAAVETLLFYHPAVWWVSKQVRAEREHCCDDLAVDLCDRLVYVSALTDLAAMRLPKAALAATGGSLLGRVQRILGAGDRAASGGAWIPALVALVVLGGLVPALTFGRVATSTDRDHQRTSDVAAIEEATPEGEVPGAPHSATVEVPLLQEQSTVANERARAEVRALVDEASQERRKLDEQRLALERRKIELQTRDRLEAWKIELDALRKEFDRTKKLFDVGLVNDDVVVKIEQRMHEVELQMAQAQQQMAQRLEELALAQQYEAVQRTYDERLALVERSRARVEIGTMDAQDARERVARLERQLAELKMLLENEQVAVSAAGRRREERALAETQEITNPAELIRAGDQLAIEIAGETELPRAYLVQNDGTIRLPILGAIKVAGMTVQQAGQAITKQVSRVNTSASVRVSLHRPRREGTRR